MSIAIKIAYSSFVSCACITYCVCDTDINRFECQSKSRKAVFIDNKNQKQFWETNARFKIRVLFHSFNNSSLTDSIVGLFTYLTKYPKNETINLFTEESLWAVFINAADALSIRIDIISTYHDLDLLSPIYSLKFEITERAPPPLIFRMDETLLISTCRSWNCIFNVESSCTRRPRLEVAAGDNGSLIPEAWHISNETAYTKM